MIDDTLNFPRLLYYTYPAWHGFFRLDPGDEETFRHPGNRTLNLARMNGDL